MTLALAAQERWRKVNAPHLVALVRAGATFKDGVLVTPTPPAEVVQEEVPDAHRKVAA